MRLTSWLVVLIAVLAVFVDIPKHQFSFPFNCPGICLRIGDFQVNQEIKTHLGLDLQGGTQLILRLQYDKLPPGSNATRSELQNQAINVIDRRINAVGVSEPVIQGLGDDKILLELPGVTDIQQANDFATRQAFLEIKVPDKDKPGEYKSLEPPLTGADLNPNGVFVTFEGTRPVVHFEFPGDGRQPLGADLEGLPEPAGADHARRPGDLRAGDPDRCSRRAAGIIEGNFTTKTANDLAIQLKSGSLPVPLEVIQSSRIEPTLGRDSVQQSVVAGIIGLLLVAFFMIAYYRLPGVLAVIALLYYAALTYAIFRLVPVTLTLAGIAGFLLSIGMAADANVLTFERLKEELRTGKSLRAAVEEGRKRAFPSIFYSNLATIMTAGVLFWFGTGTVKGFALTLVIGVARLILHRGHRHADAAAMGDRVPRTSQAATVGRRRACRRHARHATHRRAGDAEPLMIRFVERKWLYFAVSGLLIVPGIIFLLHRRASSRASSSVVARSSTSASMPRRALPRSAKLMSGLGREEAQIIVAEGGRVEIRTFEMTAAEQVATEDGPRAKYGARVIDVNPQVVSPSFSARAHPERDPVDRARLAPHRPAHRVRVPGLRLDRVPLRHRRDPRAAPRRGAGARALRDARLLLRRRDRQPLRDRGPDDHRLLGPRHDRGVRPDPREPPSEPRRGTESGHQLLDHADHDAVDRYGDHRRLHAAGPLPVRRLLDAKLRPRAAGRGHIRYVFVDLQRQPDRLPMAGDRGPHPPSRDPGARLTAQLRGPVHFPRCSG